MYCNTKSQRCMRSFILEAKVLPSQKNVTVPKGFPFTLVCISWDLNTIKIFNLCVNI